MSCLILIFVPSELLSVKIENSKSNYILNWISIGLKKKKIEFQLESNFEPRVYLIFKFFVVSELLSTKTKESKSNQILN